MLSSIFPLLAVLPFTLSSPQALPCILSGEPCPAHSTCKPNTPCGGLCLTPFVPPPVTPCIVGTSSQPCGRSEICTPTEVCATPAVSPCGGQCLYTGPATVNPNNTLPTKPCIVGGCDCADQAPGVFCSQTETCNGICAYSTSLASTCTVTSKSSSSSSKSLTITKPPTTTTEASSTKTSKTSSTSSSSKKVNTTSEKASSASRKHHNTSKEPSSTSRKHHTTSNEPSSTYSPTSSVHSKHKTDY